MNVTVMSGLPGSGKSTWVEKYLCGCPRTVKVVSTDDYFMVEGEYRFDPSKIGQAHDYCLSAFLSAMRNEVDVVIVDNTNTTAVEIAPYYRVAACLGYEVEIVRFHVDPILAYRRNVHGVPLGTIMAMYARMMADTLPPFWKVVHLLAGE